MVTEVYIEGQRADISADISSLLTFAIDDVKDFSSRQTTFSKTIVLPGTANNNRLFGHIFQPGQENEYDPALDNIGYNFNAAKAADCIIFQDQIQTFKGVLRLLQVNNTQGYMEYEVSVFGKLFSLNVALSSSLLEQLDFSAYDHVYNDANITASWDNPGGTGYYYPLIDYGTYSVNKHDWDIRTFRPATYVYEIIDKMFTRSGFRWQSDLFETPRFRSLIIPYNKKQLTALANTLFEATINTTRLYEIDDLTAFEELPIVFDANTGTGFTANVEKTEFTYIGAVATNVTFEFTFTGNQDFPFGFFGTAKIRLIKNDTQEIYATPNNTLPTPDPFTISVTLTIPMSPSDKIRFDVWGRRAEIEILSGSFTATSSLGVEVPIFVGSSVNMNDVLPKNIRQVDFLVGIVKLFNLYVYEDVFDPNLIHLNPWINFYSTDQNTSVDWTYKLDRSQAIKTKPMSELNAKIYKFKFKQDNDFYNELYKKRYNEGYGDRVYDSEYEFATQAKEFEIIFSSTPLIGYENEDKVYSTIFKQSNGNEETIDSNIRIMQSMKIAGVTPWAIKDGPATLNTLTRYGYAGHFNNPDFPTDDLNFGTARELFFVLATGDLTNNQFNVYWSGYMAEITDKDSKLVTAKFYLNPSDIANLDFSKYVYLDGVLFRLNAIKDYNATKPATCTVELLKVNELNFTQASPPEGPPEGNYLLWANDNVMYYDGPADDEELLWRSDAVNPSANYHFEKDLSFGGTATGWLRIFKNAVEITSFTGSTDGALVFSVGDVIEARLSNGLGLSNDLIISSDVDGLLYDTPGSSVTKIFSWTAQEGRIYQISAFV